MHRVLSWKRLLIVAGVLLVCSVAAAGVHYFQSKRHASLLKERAEKEVTAAAGDMSKTDEAVALYGRYLKFNPRDEEAYAKYADLMLARAKADPKASQTTADALAGFLRQFPNNPDQRRKLIDLLLKLGLFNTAREHLTLLFNTPGADFAKDPALLEQSATCNEIGGDIPRAVEDLDKAIETGTAPVKTVERMIGLLQANPSFRSQRYDISVYTNKLITDPPYNTMIAARVLAGRTLLARGQLENARTFITYAMHDMPGGTANPEALLAAAELALVDAAKDEKSAEAHHAVARRHLERAFDLDPKDIRIGILLADSYSTINQPDKAVDVLRRAAETLGEPNDQFLRVVDRLIDYGETELSTKLVEKLATNDLDRERIAKYFRGRLAVVRGDWTQARALLEEVAPVLARVPEFHKKAFTDLSKCYATLHNPDKQLEYARGARKDDPGYLPAVVAEAEALSKLRRVREALPLYRVVVVGHRLEGFRPTLLRLELLSTLMLPPPLRKWGAFDEALGPPEKRTAEIHILHAEALATRGEVPAATALLNAVLKDDPKNAAAWMALARGRDGGRPEATLALLERAQEQFGDQLPLRLAKAVVLADRTKRPQPADFRALAAQPEKFNVLEQHRLWFGLGEAAMRAANGQPDDTTRTDMLKLAVEFFEKAAALQPLDLISRAILIDLGLMTANKALVDRALDEIALAEGAKGPIGTLGKVAARLPEVRKMDDKAARKAAFKELRDEAKRAREVRSGWSRIAVALAQLDDAEGLYESALGYYREAIDKGDRQEFVLRRAVELYRDRKQDDQAVALLNSLTTEMTLPDDLERYRAIRDLLAKDLPKSERPTIERIAPLASPDFRVRLLRGALMAAIREDKDAEEAFRAAVALGDHSPETWTALITHLARQQKTADAKEAMKEAAEKLKPKPAAPPREQGDLLVSLAGCYEIVGDLKAAGEHYQQAVALAPLELTFNRQWVWFLQRHGQQQAAADVLKKLAASPAQDLARWGRRTLAMSLLVGRQAYLQRFTALNLIDENLKTDPTDAEDLKARAVVLTIDPLTRDDGMRTLGDYAKRFDLSPEEFYLLARLNFDQGKVTESLDFFTYAARPQPGVTLQHLSGLIRVHLALNKVDRAAEVLERLKTAAPASWEAAREEAVILHRQSTDLEKAGKKDEGLKLREKARAALLQFPGSRAEAFVRYQLGPALEELGFLEDAEVAYTRLLNDPEAKVPHLPLCVFLIGQKRSDQVIKLAKAHDTDKTPVVVTAQLLSAAIRAKNPGGADERFVEDWINIKMRQYEGKKELPALVAARAELLDAQEKYDAAIAEYRRAIEIDAPDNSDLVKNNLAALIALHRPQDVELAIKMMTDLIGVRGPAPAFLDTRAVAYLVKGSPADAVKDLDLALMQQRKPLYLFHLGWAYDLIPEKRPFSSQTLAEAKRLGMTADLLHPLEQKKFGTRYGLGK